METHASNIHPQSPEFLANSEHQRALAAEVRQRLELVRQGGDPKYRAPDEQGKLFVRETAINTVADLVKNFKDTF